MNETMRAGVTTADVELKLGGADVSVGALSPEDSKEKIVVGEYLYDTQWPTRAPEFRSEVRGNEAEIEFFAEGRNIDKQRLLMNFSDQLVYDLKIDAGAIDAHLDFSNLKVRECELNFGASDLHLSLGDTGMNSKIKINGAACDIAIAVPESVGLKIKFSGMISDTNFLDSGLLMGDRQWVSPNYGDAKTTVDITLFINAGSVHLERPDGNSYSI